VKQILLAAFEAAAEPEGTDVGRRSNGGRTVCRRSMVWMIRNPGGQYANELLDKGIVGLGWRETGHDLKTARTPKDFYSVTRSPFR
jgi:hypothetical protein